MSGRPRIRPVPNHASAMRREPASPYVVVAGTDTGVGKTVVTAGLAHALVAMGLNVAAIKPVESGCGEEVSPEEDGAILARATGQAEPSSALIRLRAPLTPALAADREGIEIEMETLLDSIHFYGCRADITLVEPAGGLCAPITWQETPLSLARALGAGVVLVSADRLGTISHTLLSLAALRDMRLHGMVLSAPAEPDESTGTDMESIVRYATHHSLLADEPRPWTRHRELPRVEGVEEAARHLQDLAYQLARDTGLL